MICCLGQGFGVPVDNMSLVAMQGRWAPYPHMDNAARKTTPSEKVMNYARALKILRVRAGLSQEGAAEKIRSTKQSWQKYEAGEVKAILRIDRQAELAEAIGASVEELQRFAGELGHAFNTDPVALVERDFRDNGPMARELVIRDRVQAGAFLLADDSAQTRPPTYPTVRDPRYPHADQWLSEVVGDSVDALHIFDGDLVKCVDAIAINYWPQTGHIVEVERLRFDGAERELTIKQIEVQDDRILLWPRSTNPRWSQPVELSDGVRPGDDFEVRIRGLVIAAIRRF